MSNLELDETEDAPLLDVDENQDESIAASDSHQTFKSISARWQVKSPKTIVLIVAFLMFCVVTSGMLLLLPVYRLIEDSVCHVYYEDDSLDLIEEMKCKVDEVQSRLAYMLGWMGLVSSIMSLIVTFPYGMLADRIGRKPTAVFAYSGMVFSFAFGPFMLGKMQHYIRSNPYVLMIGSLFLLVGGGVPVLLATLYAIAADVSSEKEKAASFLYLTFGTTAGGLVGPFLAGLLMEKFGPWVPIFVVYGITPFVFLVFLFIPETLTIDAKAQKADQDVTFDAVRQHLAKGLRDLGESLSMFKNRNVPLVLITFLFQNARFTARTSILVQYISKHFGWRLAETSFLLSPLGILNLIILAVLPKISQILMSPRFGYTSFGKDLFLTRASTTILLIGAIIEGFGHNIVLFLLGLFIETFGAAAGPLARATVTHYVEPEFTSRLYAMIGVSEIAGSFIGGPVLAWCFAKGLQRKGVWTGLPWFYIAFLSLVAWIALIFVRPPPWKSAANAEDGEDMNGLAEEDLFHED